jgi:hypothetical protein
VESGESRNAHALNLAELRRAGSTNAVIPAWVASETVLMRRSMQYRRTDHRTAPDAAGLDKDRPLTSFVLVGGRYSCVAGQGFEPWKASADGFTDRCRSAPRSCTLKCPVCALTTTSPHVPGTVTVGIWAVCGPSQQTKQRSTTNNDADQR